MVSNSIIVSKNKQSLEYIPCSCFKSHKIKIMRMNLGKVAELMYIDLMKFIGSQKHTGYWIVWNQDAKDVFRMEYDYSKEEMDKYFDYFFEKNFFSSSIFQKYNIITGEEIQQVWLLCAKKRMRFLEGIIVPLMIVPFEKEVEENQKRFSRFNKLVDGKNEGTEGQDKEVDGFVDSLENEFEDRSNLDEHDFDSTSDSMSKHEILQESLTSAMIQQSTSTSTSKSEAISNSIKQNYILPTEVEIPLAVDKKIEIDADRLISGFESEKTILTKTNSKPHKTLKSSGDKKLPHPARNGILEVWELKNQLKYVQDKDNNVAIASFIKKLEGSISFANEMVTNETIKQKYVWLWDNKHHLNDFLQKQFRSFVGIDKYFNDIIGDIREALILKKKGINRQEEADISTIHPSRRRIADML